MYMAFNIAFAPFDEFLYLKPIKNLKKKNNKLE